MAGGPGEACCRLVPVRYQLAALAFVGFSLVYALRVNLSVALVSMVTGNSTHKSPTDECPATDSDNSSVPIKTPGQRYDWDRDTQGLVLSSFFYGYVVTQLPGGWLANKYGGKHLLGGGMLITALFTLISPLVAEWNVYMLIMVRLIEGLGEGVTIPAMHAMWAEWAPPMERTKLLVMSYSGASFGTVIALPLSGYLCDNLGWPSVFYLSGGIGVVWYIFWLIFTADNPESHRWISEKEKTYIVTALSKQRIKKKGDITFRNTPWFSILTSVPVWGLMIAHFCYSWALYTLLTCLPIFMSDVLHFNLSKDSLLSSLPYLALFIMGNTTAVVTDVARSKGWIKTGAVRKLTTGIGYVVAAGCLVGVGYVGCDYDLAVILLCIAGGFAGISSVTTGVNHLDIAPKYAGTLMGIDNTIGNIPGFLAPQVVGWITDKNSTSDTWRTVFYISAEIYIFGFIMYTLLGSGDIQSWAKDGDYEELPQDDDSENRSTENVNAVNNSYQNY